ncbi:hypothetical protein EIP86_004728 [Pleurotus ostreatoroseus]|nr:hypothetical protein EIP86_004728 [Pleurotus ostreatoroseus]
MPALTTVIPAMDKINELLTTYALNYSYRAPIRAACRLAKKTLNRYYEKTDLSEMYRISMILQPRFKLSYFECAKWPNEWIETAESVLWEEFARSYAGNTARTGEDIGSNSRATEKKDGGTPAVLKSVISKLPINNTANDDHLEDDWYEQVQAAHGIIEVD